MASPRFNGQPQQAKSHKYIHTHTHIYIYIYIYIYINKDTYLSYMFHMNVYIWLYTQLSASFYLYTCVCHCLSSSPCMQKDTNKHISNAHVHFQPRKNIGSTHDLGHVQASGHPNFSLLTLVFYTLEAFPATPPIKECSNLWWNEHPTTLISWRSEFDGTCGNFNPIAIRIQSKS